MKCSSGWKVLIITFSIFASFKAHAGIDWSQYGDEPAFFLGWEKSFFFALGAIILFGLSWLLTECNKDKTGNVDEGVGCLLGFINVAMVICAICSFYLLLPLYLIYTLIKK